MDRYANVRSALLERDHEVDRLQVVVRGAGRRSGEALAIEGAAGIGKSRLLERARADAADLGLRVLDARGTELERGFPYGVMRQLLERLLLEADESDRERWLAGAAGLASEVLAGPVVPADAGESAGPSPGDSDYARQHGLYWLASNLSSDAPLMLVVDDLQWCDTPSLRALMFIARRLEGQPLALLMATRPPEGDRGSETAALLADSAVAVLRPSPLTEQAVSELVAARLFEEPEERFVSACLEVTGGNPFYLGELLGELSARGVDRESAAAADLGAIVPRGVANAVLLRLARLSPEAVALARALAVLGDGAMTGDLAMLAAIAPDEAVEATHELIAAEIVEPGATVRFVHPILGAAIYGDLSSAERERLHHTAAGILRERDAPVGRVAAQVMHTGPAGDAEVVALLRAAAREALGLGDAAGAALLLQRALDEPPDDGERAAVLLELGQAHARAGAADAVGPLSEIVDHGERADAIAAAAIELSGMLFFAGRVAEGAAVLRRARARLPAGEPAREQLEVAILGVSSTSASARRDADAAISALRDPGRPARNVLESTTLATLAMDEAVNVGSASAVRDLAERAMARGLPVEPHRGENWALLALGVLGTADGLEEALRGADDILARARVRGAALTVVTVSSLRALIAYRLGDLNASEADAEAAIELAPTVLGARFLVMAVAAAVLTGLEREQSPESLRRLIERTGVWYDDDFTSGSQLRYASGVLRAAAGNHPAAIEELLGTGELETAFGGENPALLPWRSAAALSLAELDRQKEAVALAAEEVSRAKSFGAARAIGIALRAHALVGPSGDRARRLEEAVEVLASSPARLEHARALVDLGASMRAAGKRTAAREPLLEGLAASARCGGKALETRARSELAAIGVRAAPTGRTGADSLTPSELRVARLAAEGGTNREIAQALFVTEKTVETHLGRAFRKLDISSRRQLRDVLAAAEDE
jgi:DNA-binding CsgD family transcriptional regulator